VTTPPPDDKSPKTPAPGPDEFTPPLRKVEVDKDGMARPQRPRSTTDSKTPTQPVTMSRTGATPPAPPPPPDATVLHRAAPRGFRRIGWGRLILWSGIGLVVLASLGMLGLAYGYWSIARTLPSVDDLKEHASQFETTRLYDARGNLLYEIVDPQAGRRTRVALDKISPYLIAATIATEDREFYSHPGFDPIAIARAVWQNAQAGETVSGASTITQQLVRALVLTPEERAQRSSLRKLREIILAAEITRTYSKDEILELYLNEIYYGNLAYGIEAAAETYFHKPASALTLSESAFLAGLPQSPAIYDVFTNREAAYARQQQVLSLLLGAGCVPVSTQVEPVCVDTGQIGFALVELQEYPFTPPKSDARFPHWVDYIRFLLEEQYGAQTIYRSGFSVYTTLDPDLQDQAQQAVTEQIAALADRHVTDGALVAVRPTTGEILAMVGSDDYNDPLDGQINMALRPRQPGSSIKPLTYALAFEKGWNPATLLWDVPTEFPDGANPPYKPVNYDGRFHGPVLLRAALANSYNIPAVKALQFVGIYGTAQNLGGGQLKASEGFIPFAETLGFTSLDRDDYGLSLTLGGGEVPLLQMVGGFAALADGGARVFPVAILKITDGSGQTVCQQPLRPADLKSDPPPCQIPPENWGQGVFSPETAYLLSDILSDNAARTPAFGPNSPLVLSFPAAVKTGTTNDFRDNWTIGYTPDLVAGVWVGNPDFSEMEHTTGVTGAAPIWHTFMEAALAGKAAWFNRPAAIIEKQICAVSGAEPGEQCPPDQIRTEIFAAANPPPDNTHDLRQRIFLDPYTGLRQTADCARFYQQDLVYAQELTVVNVTDPWARKWLSENPNGQAWAEAHGLTPPLVWAPDGECTAESPHPIIAFAYPAEGATFSGGVGELLRIRGLQVSHLLRADGVPSLLTEALGDPPGEVRVQIELHAPSAGRTSPLSIPSRRAASFSATRSSISFLYLR